MALDKVEQATVLAIQDVASNASVVGDEIDVSLYYEGNVRIRFGRGTGTAFTTPPIFRLQVCYDSSSPTNQQWADYSVVQPPVGASIGSQATSSGDGVGSTAVTLAAGTNFTAGDFVFFHQSGANIALSEWHRQVLVAGAVITILEGLVNDQAAATVRDQAEEYNISMNLASVQKIRLICESGATGQAYVVEAVGAFVEGL